MGSHKNHQRYVQKVLGILARPNVTLASIKLKPSESILTILVLYMMVLIKGLLELNYMGERDRMGWLIIGSAFGLVAAWFGLTTLFHFVARILGGSGSYKNTLLLMGYIAVPMIITSFLSLLVYIISPLIMPEWSGMGLNTHSNWLGGYDLELAGDIMLLCVAIWRGPF